MTTEPQLVGHWFHAFDADGKVTWQGQVFAEVSPGVFLVQTFSWLTGAAHTRHIVKLETMLTWTFYQMHEDMIGHWEDTLRHSSRAGAAKAPT